MIHVIGEGIIPEARAFDDVRDALQFDCDVYLSAMWAPLVGKRIPDDAVIYNMEPLYDDCRSFTLGYFDTLSRCRVLDYSMENVRYLKNKGINAFYLPYGYHPSLERVHHGRKFIDILLVGSVNDRRAQIVNELRKHFNVTWVTGAYGRTLDELVAASRVCLNVHYIEGHPLEVVRLNYLMANHCTIVTEPGNDDDLNDQYSSGCYMTDNLIDACGYALDHPLDGYDCIKTMPMNCIGANQWIKEALCLGQ